MHKKERTLAIIKPDAFETKCVGEIISVIEKAGLDIINMRLLHMNREQASEFYAEHKNKPFFTDLVDYMTSGSVAVIELEAYNAIKLYRDILGVTDPTKAQEGTIRKLFAHSKQRNAAHGSDSKISAERELRFFFG